MTAAPALHTCLCCGNKRPNCSPVNDIGFICPECEQGNRGTENDLDEILRRWR